jgi:hypothetical protein
MTSQRDPDSRRFGRREDGSWSVGAFLAGLAALVVVIFLAASILSDRTGDPVTPRSPGATAPTTVTPSPGNTPAPAPATKP